MTTPITRKLASGRTAVLDANGRVVTILPPEKASPEAVALSRKPAVSGQNRPVYDEGECRQECGNCRDGVFYISGRMVNGVFQGKTGVCFQCEGKGWTTPADRKRTDNYYRYHYRVHL
jgi:hypothetical protein